jgi:hypothetical protein
MSHFTTIRTKMVELDAIKRALDDLGYRYADGPVDVRGYANQTVRADLRIDSGRPGRDIGLRRSGETYELVADWYELHVDAAEFTNRLSQRYAYHVACDRLAAQGFSLVSEQQGEGERIHLVLRRAV